MMRQKARSEAARGSIETLSSFLPVDLLTRLHGPTGDRPVEVDFPAAVLFADVSRYTSLVEQLVQRGPTGFDQIPTLLERSYTHCIDQVYELGGEVLHFAGDALVAYWPADLVGLRSAVSAATAAAKRICSDRAGPDAPHGPLLHVGVGAGPLWAAAVGGQSSWSLLVAGDAVRGAAAAHAEARRGEFALSATAEAVLHNPERGPFSMPTPVMGPPPTQRWLSDFLPAELRAHVSPSVEPVTEIRPVTSLFVSIRGLDGDGSGMLAKHQALCSLLQTVLQDHDGPDGQLVFDDKGLVFTAVFGTPGRFHHDDVARAIQAAQAIEARIAELGAACAIGIGTGDALFRVVGANRRRQMMVIGTPMNRAARLMTIAGSGVLCDSATERTCRTHFHFETAGSVQLTGLGQEEAIYRPIRPRPADKNRTPLIGRQNELYVLGKAFGEAASGQRRLVVVSGEPGIGKTRLVAAFAEDLRSQDVVVTVAPAERGDRRSSFLTWRRVLAQMVGLPVDAEGTPILDALRARLAGDAAALDALPLLADVVHVPLDESEGTRHLDGVYRADATMRLLGNLLTRLAPSPLVLVFEDGQWMDSASWRLLEMVLSIIPRVLIVVCVRAGEAPDELVSLKRRAEARIEVGTREGDDPHQAHWIRTIDLEDLDDLSIANLLLRTLDGQPPDEELARKIAQLARGNPFFAEEIALTLKSEGLIAIRDGFWRPIRTPDVLRHFDAVEGVIRERVDRLGADAQRVLKAAAVIGRSFGTAALHGLLVPEMEADAIADVLDRLEAAYLIRRAPDAQGYQFRHDQTRDVVHGSIPSELRQKLHGRLADWIEQHTDDGNLDIAALVHRFEAAGDKPKTVKYAERAAAQALRTGAFREAAVFLNICLKHESPSSAGRELLDAVRRRRQLGEAHYGLGDLSAQATAVQRALALAGDPTPGRTAMVFFRTLRVVGRLVMQQVLPGLFTRARATRREWQLEISRCLSQAAVGDYFEQRILTCLMHTVGTVIHAERAGPTSDLVRAYGQMACSLRIAGLPRFAQHFEARAEATATAVGDPAVLAYAVMLEALSHIGYGDWDTVEQRLDRSQELAMRTGDQITWCNAQAVRFWSRHYQGRHTEAERAANELLATAQKSGNLQQELWGLRCKAVVALSSDRPREACDLLRVMTTAMSFSTDVAEVIGAKGYLSLALTRTGAQDEGIRVATEVLTLVNRMSHPTVHSVLGGISGVAEVLLRGRQAGLAREYPEWSAWERSALGILNRYRRHFPIGASRFGLWAGLSDWLNGRQRRALSRWKAGLAAARRLSLRQDESMIAAELRRHDQGAS